MCGIGGLMRRDGAPPPAAPLAAIRRALAHRGPDGAGRYRSGDVGMAHTRLAIIDLESGEPPLHLYRRHGLDFALHLRGMYALALHDPAAGRLVLARDPFGIKPLYYAELADGFAFASQPRALFAAGLVSPALCVSARNELVQMQFTTGRRT